MSTAIMPVKEPKRAVSADFPYKSFDDLPVYDQRYMPRWITPNKVYYRNKNGQLIVATQLKDMHLGGACLHVNGHVHVNQLLHLKIFLDRFHSFEAAGTVMWKLGNGDKSIAGVAFEPLDEPAQDIILEYAFENRQEIAMNSCA